MPSRLVEAPPLLRFNFHYDFLWYIQMARIMIILEVEVTFVVNPFTDQVGLVLQDIRPLFYLIT